MTDSLFEEGGPYQIRRRGADQYEFKISLPTNVNGRIARECPSTACSPGYFKVKLGTGVTGGALSYCPYCRQASDPNDFATEEQIRYGQDLMLNEAQDAMGRMIKNTLGLDASGKRKYGGGFISMEMAYKPGAKPLVRRPVEEQVQRDVICPHCGLDHSVYGLATWCPDCGKDILLAHIEAEFAVVRLMLSDIERRRDQLGVRIAAKDLENCLEDTVSIFEAVLRAISRRGLVERGVSAEDIAQFFRKVGNGFQNPNRAESIFQEEFTVSLLADLSPEEVQILLHTFEKRHPITHNLGVIDKKYLEKVQTAEKEGREIFVTAEEVENVIELALKSFRSAHRQMFPEKSAAQS